MGQGSQELPFCKACKSICVMLSDPDKHFDIYDMSFTDPKSNSFAKVETAKMTKPFALPMCTTVDIDDEQKHVLSCERPVGCLFFFLSLKGASSHDSRLILSSDSIF